jgi:hypothetical protein
MFNTKRRRRLQKLVARGKPIRHLVSRSRNLRFMPDEATALQKELSAKA